MSKFFMAYSGDNPAAIDIKGHRLVILTNSVEDLANGLPLLGADAIKEVDVVENDANSLAELASSVSGGVVVTPAGMSISSMIIDLERELPWVH